MNWDLRHFFMTALIKTLYKLKGDLLPAQLSRKWFS